jgi:hypothetical protein
MRAIFFVPACVALSCCRPSCCGVHGHIADGVLAAGTVGLTVGFPRTATDRDRRKARRYAHGWEYYGSDGFLGWAWHPIGIDSGARSRDADIQRRLREESERLTGVSCQGAGCPFTLMGVF